MSSEELNVQDYVMSFLNEMNFLYDFKDKTVITEFMANNMADLRQKMAFTEFEMFKSLISCMIFIHSPNSIEVFDKNIVQKYLA